MELIFEERTLVGNYFIKCATARFLDKPIEVTKVTIEVWMLCKAYYEEDTGILLARCELDGDAIVFPRDILLEQSCNSKFHAIRLVIYFSDIYRQQVKTKMPPNDTRSDEQIMKDAQEEED